MVNPCWDPLRTCLAGHAHGKVTKLSFFKTSLPRNQHNYLFTRINQWKDEKVFCTDREKKKIDQKYGL